MIKFTTESGAEYVYDANTRNVVRLDGPYSPGINYDRVPDGFWQGVEQISKIEVGHRVHIVLSEGLFRTTTPVVSIEEFS